MAPPVASYFRSHWFLSLPTATKKFSGQTIIITGSNTGLGLEAARHIVRLGAARVILAVRDPARGAAAEKAIRESAGGAPEVAIEVWEVDLASYASVQAFAARAAALDRLDVVVENAGVLTHSFAKVEDNERTITINVISTMLMALLLLPKLRATSEALDKDVVLTFTGSFVHWLTSFPQRKADSILQECASEDRANMNDRYNVSKLMELLAVRELSTQLTESGKPGRIITSVINPGSVHTDLGREAHGMVATTRGFLFHKLIARSAEEGSRTLVHAAYGGPETHGQYLDDCKVADPKFLSDFVRSTEGMETQKKLWKELLAKLETIQPGISQNI